MEIIRKVRMVASVAVLMTASALAGNPKDQQEQNLGFSVGVNFCTDFYKDKICRTTMDTAHNANVQQNKETFYVTFDKTYKKPENFTRTVS